MDSQNLITPRKLLRMFEEIFPGAFPVIQEMLTGIIISIEIWEFQITATLTTKSTSYTETQGRVVLRFLQKKENLPFNYQEKETFLQNEVEGFLKHCRAILQGIIVAIQNKLQKVKSWSPPPMGADDLEPGF